jgi:hypothetical protein
MIGQQGLFLIQDVPIAIACLTSQWLDPSRYSNEVVGSRGLRRLQFITAHLCLAPAISLSVVAMPTYRLKRALSRNSLLLQNFPKQSCWPVV